MLTSQLSKFFFMYYSSSTKHIDVRFHSLKRFKKSIIELVQYKSQEYVVHIVNDQSIQG